MIRTTAFGTWRFANEYCRAAEMVEVGARTELDLSAPRYYLLGHSIELSLKAFLLAKGVPLSELRSMKLMGHDLEKALIRADNLGFSQIVELSDEERGSILLLNQTYQPKEHEYITTGYVVWPKTFDLFSALKTILPAIKPICLEATLQEKNAE